MWLYSGEKHKEKNFLCILCQFIIKLPLTWLQLFVTDGEMCSQSSKVGALVASYIQKLTGVAH